MGLKLRGRKLEEWHESEISGENDESRKLGGDDWFLEGDIGSEICVDELWGMLRAEGFDGVRFYLSPLW